MLRGAIEVADQSHVSGWIVSSAGQLRGHVILAFSGKRCVGAGTVEIFRQDLLMANVGDGYAGFDFPIELAADQDPASVVVRLKLCDAVLLQAGCEVVRQQPTSTAARLRPVPDRVADRPDRKSA